MKIDDALARAAQVSLDLVEISPNAEPPVCRIMDFGKYQFERSKKKAAQRKKTKTSQLKEIKFRPSTDVGDYQVKLRNITKFLANGDKVKVTVRFRGREMAHHQLGSSLLERVKKDVAEIAVVEQQSKFEGRQIIMVLAPAANK